MANVDVVNLNGEKVGSIELADTVFGADQVNEALLVGGGEALPRLAPPGTRRPPRAAPKSPAPARSFGSRRARAALVSAFGALASLAPRLHGAWTSAAQLRLCAVPRKKLLGALRSGAGLEARGRQADRCGFAGDQGRQDRRSSIAALDKLNVTRTALLVENGKTLTQGWLLGARNLKGVELVLNNEVHPYDLLRYERAIFSTAAIEQLSEALERIGVEAQAAAHTEAA